MHIAGMSFEVHFHHGGGFIDEDDEYRGGSVHVEFDCDIDRWSYFEAMSIVNDLGYSSIMRLWWKTDGPHSADGLREIKEDGDAMAFANDAIQNNGKGEIFVTEVVENYGTPSQGVHHIVAPPPPPNLSTTASILSKLLNGVAQTCGVNMNSEGGGNVSAEGNEVNEDNDVIFIGEGWVGDDGGDVTVDVDGDVGVGDVNRDVDGEVAVDGPKGDHVNDNGDTGIVGEGVGDAEDGGSEEESDHGVMFEDSEEDRALGLDDGFGDEVGNAEHNNETLEELIVSKKKKKPVGVVGGSGQGGGSAQHGLSAHDLSDDYMSEELDSAEEGDSDGEDKCKGVFPRFRKEELDKKYKFKLGMEFKSLKQFKKAILKWSVLNGREVRFAKNDKVRVRAVCKGNCGFTALVSRVGDSHTYRMKTLVDRHTCGRVFANKNAKSKWVAKGVMDRIMGGSDVSLAEIIQDVRRNYATGITVWSAWKAKQIARGIVEGDALKQYTLLWSYCAELKRACAGNTCRLEVERPCPSVPPKFGSFYFCFDGCKRGFLAGCRPFVGVDGCHLKTKYGGQLLIAVGRDPNDQYYPLAFAVVENETKESWRWFLTLLLQDIEEDRRWVFISDQQKVHVSTIIVIVKLYI